MFKHFFQEKIILPLSDILTGQQVSKYLKFMLESQHWSRAEIDEFQNNRLRELIEHAYNHVPFYHDVMVERNLTPNDIQSKEDLVKLPIISKEVMRREGIERFTADNIPSSERIKRSSSGSTGQPFVYYSTKLAYSVNIAANLRGWYNFGWRLGDRYVKISQNPRKTSIKRLQDWITGCLYIPTADLSDEHMYEIMCEIEKNKPVVIRSYTDPLFIMAQYRLSHKGEFTHNPKVITTTGNVLRQNERETIERAFCCKIFDAYGSEGNSILFECKEHNGYFSSEEYGITEVLDDKDNRITQGAGRLITTDLWNYAHPFIRYDVQDKIELSSEKCDCGTEHLHVRKIWGRDNELLVAPSGRKYTVHHFTVFFETTVTPELKDSINRFQFIQHKDGSTTILLEVNERYDIGVKQFLQNYWSTEFGASVEIKVVDRIPIMHNNKRRFIIIEHKNDNVEEYNLGQLNGQ